MSPERLAEIREWLLDRSYRDRLQIAARSWTDVGLLVADRDRLEAEKAALRSALEAARMPHQRVEGDPWFTCPVAWREDNEEWTTTCFQCDGKPCDHGCNCGADEQNAGIDRALATPSRRREGEADV
jgi:hypothetical protein